MYSSLRSAMPFLLTLLLTAGLLAGCGGGESGNGGSQEDAGQQQDQQQDQSKKSQQETKIALGTVARVNPENERRIVLKPNARAEEQEGGPMVFKIRKNADVTLDGQQAEVGDVGEGQQAQIKYVVKNEVNRAISLQLFKASGEDGNSN